MNTLIIILIIISIILLIRFIIIWRLQNRYIKAINKNPEFSLVFLDKCNGAKMIEFVDRSGFYLELNDKTIYYKFTNEASGAMITSHMKNAIKIIKHLGENTTNP